MLLVLGPQNAISWKSTATVVKNNWDVLCKGLSQDDYTRFVWQDFGARAEPTFVCSGTNCNRRLLLILANVDHDAPRANIVYEVTRSSQGGFGTPKIKGTIYNIPSEGQVLYTTTYTIENPGSIMALSYKLSRNPDRMTFYDRLILRFGGLFQNA